MNNVPTCCNQPMKRVGVSVGDYLDYVCENCGGDTSVREGEEPTQEAPWPYMHGTLLRRRQNGQPEIVEHSIVNFQRHDVVSYGKAAFLGRQRIMCMVRLHDGREVSIKTSRQPRRIDRTWLNVTSKFVPLHHHQYVPSIEEPFIERWVDIAEARKAMQHKNQESSHGNG